MPTVDVYNQNREKVEEISLSEEVFAAPVRQDLMHAVVRYQLAKKRQGTHKVKGRAEVRGGGKKRKKKTYTKPKKTPHVHKKDKLRVLRFYKIEDDGKVTRLRKYSPVAGTAGCFMAQHFDRYYCGKTGHTYFYNKEKESS